MNEIKEQKEKERLVEQIKQIEENKKTAKIKAILDKNEELQKKKLENIIKKRKL